MADEPQGEQPMSDEGKRKAEQEAAEAAKKWVEDTQTVLDNALVARAQHFEQLAKRILSHDGEDVNYSDADARHLAEMLLLLDIAHGDRGKPGGFFRFRSRYGGNY